MILNVLPLALGVYPGLTSAATLFIDPCAQTRYFRRLSSANQGYASDVEIEIIPRYRDHLDVKFSVIHEHPL